MRDIIDILKKITTDWSLITYIISNKIIKRNYDILNLKRHSNLFSTKMVLDF